MSSTWPPSGPITVTPSAIPEGHWDVNVANISSPFATRERAEEVAELIKDSETPALDMWHLYMMDQGEMDQAIIGMME